jgi:predicted ribonuclease YlaK
MTYRILSIAIMLGIGINASAQQTDPALVGAVGVQTAMLKDIFSDREKTQQKIIAAEAAVTVAMDRMHQVENKMLDYLSNAQGAMQNLYQIKRAAELVTTEIPQNMSLVRKSVPGHLKGTAIALLVSDELTDAATQMASLFPFMKQLVTSGTYNVDGYDSQGNPTTEKHKVNLLNSAERYYVANEVVSKLETINTDLWLLAWQIRTLSWQDLWYGLDPEGWAAVMSGKAIVESLIYEWEYL